MKSNYKRIGNYIHELKVRNTEEKAEKLLGININKFFMPSVANVVGTDLSVYKLVRKNQFSCNRMHVGRDYRLPISMSKVEEEFMVSPAYDVFEIKDTEVLNPEYLMMWFSRSEFDRNAWFYTDADVRGGLPWKSFCDMQLPIPHPVKQKEIVKEYNTIVNRIALNNQLIKKLEETAQVIYREWFVDFEFSNEEGKPYKSNGGEMVESKLGEIPKGWEVSKIGNLCECNSSTLSPKDDFETIEYLDTSSLTNNEIEEIQILNLQVDEIPSRAKRKVIHNDVIFSTVRPNLRHFGILKNINGNMIVSTGFAVLRTTYPNLCSELLYLTITKEENLKNLQALAEMRVSTYPSINPEDLQNLDFILPTKDVLGKAENVFVLIFDLLGNYQKEKKILKSFREMLLSKLATIEN
jgi:type I restriction enzyme S subunit